MSIEEHSKVIPPVLVTIGAEKVSVTIFRKTIDDLLVSQLSLERWFETAEEATTALRKTIDALIAVPTNGDREVRETRETREARETDLTGPRPAREPREPREARET